MKLLALIPIVAFFLYHYIKIGRVARAEMEAFHLHCDMWDKVQELLDDPTMSYLKWKEWLPVFEAVDKRCMRLDPKMTARLGKVSDRVRRIIADDDYQQDVQRR